MDGLVKNIGNYIEAAKMEWLERGIRETADMAEKYALDNCPVYKDSDPQSGNLRDSIHVVVEKNGFHLIAGGETTLNSSGIDYSRFQEFFSSPYTAVGTVESPIAATDGSGKIAFRPFLRPAIIKARNQSPEIFGKKLYRILSR